jgi:hypothetical protein
MTTEPVDEARIGEIRRRLELTSPGPWHVVVDPDGTKVIATGRDDGGYLEVKLEAEPAGEDDLSFIAMAHEALPRLLEALGEPSRVAVSEIAALEHTIDRASAGPWRSFIEERRPIGGSSMIWIGEESYGPDLYVYLGGAVAPADDIEFIAASRQDVPDVLEELKRRNTSGSERR